MKRILSLLLIMTLVFTLSSCGNDASNKKTTVEISQSEVESDVTDDTSSEISGGAESKTEKEESSKGESSKNDVSTKNPSSSKPVTESEKHTHKYVTATCTEPKMCRECKATKGKALGHKYVGGVCERCNAKDPNSVPTTPKTKIKIATYNISHCQDFSSNHSDNAPVNLNKMAEYIKSIGADIFALNEVYFNGSNESLRDQANKIKTIAGFSAVSEAIAKNFGSGYGNLTIGNAILTNYTILEEKAVKVLEPSAADKRPNENEWYEDRVIAVTKQNIEGKEIMVITTHFGLNLLEKERIVTALCEIIDAADCPVILMGDFNALPHSTELEPIYDRLVSCADAVNNKDYTFSSYNPQKTLDYIFVSKGIEVNSFEVRKEVHADHLACVAEISF